MIHQVFEAAVTCDGCREMVLVKFYSGMGFSLSVVGAFHLPKNWETRVEPGVSGLPRDYHYCARCIKEKESVAR